MSINIIIQFEWLLGKGKLFWFLLTSLHFLTVFVNASHFRVGFCVGKNQMCLTVRWLFLYAAQRKVYANKAIAGFKPIKPLQFSLNEHRFKLPTSPGLRILRVGVSLFSILVNPCVWETCSLSKFGCVSDLWVCLMCMTLVQDYTRKSSFASLKLNSPFCHLVIISW